MTLFLLYPWNFVNFSAKLIKKLLRIQFIQSLIFAALRGG